MAADDGNETRGTAEEMRSVSEEPLLPIEIKLIAFSLILGAVLLGLLVWVSYTYFPAQ